MLFSMMRVAEWYAPCITRFLGHSGALFSDQDVPNAYVRGFSARIVPADAARQRPNVVQVFLVALSGVSLPKHVLRLSRLRRLH